MRRSWWLVLLLVLCLVPSTALADEVDVLGGFTSGLSDFVSDDVRSVDVTPESDFDDGYEPVVREVETVQFEEGTTNSSIEGVVSAWQSIPAFGATYGLIEFARVVIHRMIAGIWAYVIGLVFMWWGVRKAVRMIFAAFRKGSASV